MPMIEFRYQPHALPHECAKTIGYDLEEALRGAIRVVRANAGDYGVTVEGDPFGPISYGQPDLRIYVFYHAEWKFSKDELENVAEVMAGMVNRDLLDMGLQISSVVGFYERAGHVAAKRP